MEDSNNPFASRGLRGMTTYRRNAIEAFEKNVIM